MLTALGTALLKIRSLGEEEKVKTVLKSWIAFSLSVVAPRTPPQAPPPLEFTDIPLSKNYASVASISTKLSLNRLTYVLHTRRLPQAQFFCKLSSLTSSAISENKVRRRKISMLLSSKTNLSLLPSNETLLQNTDMSTKGRNMYRCCNMRKRQNRS